MKSFRFDIDVVGACNLRCPSCPQGNSEHYRLPHGHMPASLLRRIVQKALLECRVEGISLFNWCEPLLHPGIHELVAVVQEKGIPCHLSSNLNLLPEPDRLMAANPASFKISLSGFTQATYGITHRGGDMDRVKRHMVRLAEAKRKAGATTRIFVNYHRYRHNLKEEPMMRELVLGLGFEFEPSWALLLPLEKLLAPAEQGLGDLGADEDLVSRLALPPYQALPSCRETGDLFCPLQEEQISLDFQGNVLLCCGIFDAGRYALGNYLELSLEEIGRMRRDHPLCGRCKQEGAHLYLTYRTPELEALVLENIEREDAESLGVKAEFALARRRRLLQKIYSRCFSPLIPKEHKDRLKRWLATGLRPPRSGSGRS